MLSGYWVHGECANVVARVDGTRVGDQGPLILFSVADTFNPANGWAEGASLQEQDFLELYPEGPYPVIPQAPKELTRGGLCGEAYREGFDPIRCNLDKNHDGRCAFQWGVSK